MFGISWVELAFIFVIAIIFVDPKDIPAIARKFSGFIKDLKKISNEFSSTITKELEDPRKYIKDLEGKMQPTYDISDLQDLKKETNKEDKAENG